MSVIHFLYNIFTCLPTAVACDGCFLLLVFALTSIRTLRKIHDNLHFTELKQI